MNDTVYGVALTLVGLMLQALLVLVFELDELAANLWPPHHGLRWVWHELNRWGRLYLAVATTVTWFGVGLVVGELLW